MITLWVSILLSVHVLSTRLHQSPKVHISFLHVGPLPHMLLNSTVTSGAAMSKIGPSVSAVESSTGKLQHFDATDVVHGALDAPAVAAAGGVVPALEPSRPAVVVPALAYPLAAFALSGVVILIFGSRGLDVCIGVLLYLGALSTMTISVKLLFNSFGFVFPKFLTSLHFMVCGIVSFALLISRTQQGMPFPTPSVRQFWLMIFPMALAFMLSIGANNMALLHSSVAFAEMVSSTNCLITTVVGVCMGIQFDTWLLVPLMLVVAGAACSITGELNFSWIGLALCFTANVFRSLKVVLQQKMMTGYADERLDPCAMLFWVSLPSAAMMMVTSILTEGFEPYKAFASTEDDLRGLVLAVLLSCANAVVLNLAQLFVTKDLGAVGSQLVAQSKSILVILGGMVLFGELVTRLEMLGFGLVLLGVCLFSQIDQKSKEARQPVPQKYSRKPLTFT